ncbi:hypothetical protein V8E55_007402 [Tylopilus felleus]
MQVVRTKWRVCGHAFLERGLFLPHRVVGVLVDVFRWWPGPPSTRTLIVPTSEIVDSWTLRVFAVLFSSLSSHFTSYGASNPNSRPSKYHDVQSSTCNVQVSVSWSPNDPTREEFNLCQVHSQPAKTWTRMNMPAPNALDSSAFFRDTLTCGRIRISTFFASPCHEITCFKHRTDLCRSMLKRATSRGNSSFGRQGDRSEPADPILCSYGEWWARRVTIFRKTSVV